MLIEHLLDLARVDVVAAADDHLLLAIDEEEVAALVEPAEITGGEPALGVDRGRRRGRVVPVPVDDRRSSELHLTHAPLVRIRDANLGAARRATNGAGLSQPPGREGRRETAHLGQAVALVDVCCERLLEARARRRSERRRRRCARSGEAAARPRSAQPARARCTSSARRSAPSSESRPSSRAQASGSKRCITQTAAPTANDETNTCCPRTCGKGATPRTTSESVNDQRVRAEAGRSTDPAVREDGPFRPAGRPRREEQRGGIVLVALDDLLVPIARGR